MSPAEIVGTVAAGLTLTLLTAVGIRLVKYGKAFGLFLRDWQGEQGRPGVERKPGVMERLQSIETEQAEIRRKVDHVHYELKPNGGYSAKDQLNRLDPAFPPPVVAVAASGGH